MVIVGVLAEGSILNLLLRRIYEVNCDKRYFLPPKRRKYCETEGEEEGGGARSLTSRGMRGRRGDPPPPVMSGGEGVGTRFPFPPDGKV